jgi:hypothetical protein
VSALNAAAPSAAPGPGLTVGSGNGRAVPSHARELAAALSALFQRDVELVKLLSDAQHRLKDAGERLYPGRAPDAFGLTNNATAAAAAIGTSPIAAPAGDGGPAVNTAMLDALQQLRWTIDRAFCAYQDASEQRRQLAFEVGEYSQQLTQALCGAGYSAQHARQANVHELANTPA